jgi:hypothetical protein
VKKRASSFATSDSFTDYYEYNKNILNASMETTNEYIAMSSVKPSYLTCRVGGAELNKNKNNNSANRCKSMDSTLNENSEKRPNTFGSMPNIEKEAVVVVESSKLTLAKPRLPPPPVPTSSSTFMSQFFYSKMQQHSQPKAGEYLNDSSIDDIYNLMNQPTFDEIHLHQPPITDAPLCLFKSFTKKSLEPGVEVANSFQINYLPIQIKSKKPPSYEESMRKMV